MVGWRIAFFCETFVAGNEIYTETEKHCNESFINDQQYTKITQTPRHWLNDRDQKIHVQLNYCLLNNVASICVYRI